MAGGIDCRAGIGWIAVVRDSHRPRDIPDYVQRGIAGRHEHAAGRHRALRAVHAAVRDCVIAATGGDCGRGGNGEEEDLKQWLVASGRLSEARECLNHEYNALSPWFVSGHGFSRAEVRATAKG